MRHTFTFICSLSLIAATSPAFGVAITWDNGGGDQLWSNNSNWNADNPASGNDLTFNNTGTSGVSGTVTNIVDASVTVNSLAYTNSAAFHTTQINSGQTLTVNAGNFLVGTGGAGAATTNVMIKGSTPGVGTLTFNNAAMDFVVARSHTAFSGAQNSTLDASGLGTLNITANQLDVARTLDPSGNGLFMMAANNNVTVDQIRIGGWDNGGTMRLGQTNVIRADAIELGWAIENQGAAQSIINFNTGLTSPTVQIRNKAGSGRASLSMGFGSNGSGTGHLDLTGGTADVMLSTVILGQPRSIPCCAGNGTGTITFTAGVVDATTMVLGRGLATANAASIATGTVNVNGGTLIATTIQLADVLGPSITQGIVNINGGAVQATSIEKGPGTGIGAATRQLNFTTGTLSHKTGSDLTVTSDVSVRLLTNGTKTVFADTGRSVTINGAIINAGGGTIAGITKTGAGTLYLNGANTFTGDTIVNGGTLAGTGSLAGDLVVDNTGTFSPGLSPDIFNAQDADFNNGSTYYVEIGGTTPGTQHDQLVLSGTASVDGNLVIELINGFIPDELDTFTILDATSLTGTWDSVSVVGGLGFFEVSYVDGNVVLSNFTVPEPSTLVLVGLGMLGLAGQRRRRVNSRRAG